VSQEVYFYHLIGIEQENSLVLLSIVSPVGFYMAMIFFQPQGLLVKTR